jgi:HK97 family phage prohead protease
MRPQPMEFTRPRACRGAGKRTGFLGLAASVLDDDAIETPAIQGYVVRWHKVFMQPEGLCAFLPGAFDADLRRNKRITALTEHNAANEIGSTDTNLIFHSDEHGVGFRLFVRKGQGEIAAAMVRAGDRVGMSAGCNSRV